MTIYQVLCLIGVPTLILAVFKYLWSQIKHNTRGFQGFEGRYSGPSSGADDQRF